MKKSIWIFFLAVFLPGIVLGWLALRSAEEQQIIFERRTAQLYQKETDNFAAEVNKLIEIEKRNFTDAIHRLLAHENAEKLAEDFTNSLFDVWPRKAVGFALNSNGHLLSPSPRTTITNLDARRFIQNNASFLGGVKTAGVYWQKPPQQSFSIAVNRSKERQGLTALSADGASLISENKTAELGSDRTPKPPSFPPVIPSQDRPDTSKIPANLIASVLAGEKTANAKKPLVEFKPADENQMFEKEGNLKRDVGLKNEKTVEQQKQFAIQGMRTGSNLKTLNPDTTTQHSDFNNEGAADVEKKETSPKDNMATSGTRESFRENSGKDEGNSGGTPSEDGASAQKAPVLSNDLSSQNNDPHPGTEARAATHKMLEGIIKNGSPDSENAELQASKGRSIFFHTRSVNPQKRADTHKTNYSSLVPLTANFFELTSQGDEGIISRFVRDRLELIFWIRPPEAPDIIFGCLLEAKDLNEIWAPLFDHASTSAAENGKLAYTLALLNDKAQPVAISQNAPGIKHEWKQPFVATEVGESLPHWEAALYLASPAAIQNTARGLQQTLKFTILGALALIGLGGFLVVGDVRRQLTLAQQKTDFVSNVSHELKTPLTSIRMFAEMLHDRPPTPEKQGQYLRIITVEAERLTRLINNVLDFAKLERKQRQFDKKELDLDEIAMRVWENYEMRLRETGFDTHCHIAPASSYAVFADEDALAQILVNLLSNAEKYSGEQKDVELLMWRENQRIFIAVLDRGIGVPSGEEHKIFKAFYRAHDSLNSGIQGSGLGLTIACRLAAEHGAEVFFEKRKNGGSRFTLCVPALAKDETFSGT